MTNSASTRFKTLSRRLPWIIVCLTILLVVAVRFRLRSMPLERDEGEYAYAGQLILQGIPPYKLAYNMKLPGTYVAYSLIMAVFGQSPSGIHFGLLLVNVACIVLVFLCARRMLDDIAGAAAAAAFGLLSLSPTVLGLQAHATHFVVLPALGALYILLRAAESARGRALFASGLLFGLAFVMKQHGLLFGVFGFVYVAWVRAAAQKENLTWSKIRARSVPFDWMKYLRELSVFTSGLAVPYLLVCLWLWRAGVFPQFYFWTVQYANKYITAVPLANRSELFRNAIAIVASPNLLFWILAGAGAILMWSDRRLGVRQKVFIIGLLMCSLCAISIGFYFREHYFILLLPVLSLMIGVAVSRGVYVLNRSQAVERFLAIPTLGLMLLALGTALLLHGDVWFAQSPENACRKIYSSSLFPEAVHIGEYLRTNTPPETAIAVLGSEPEIYFYSCRHSATGYIYMYPLRERHAYALPMQEKMIQEIEARRPECVVYVDEGTSWLQNESSEDKLLTWWPAYCNANYKLVRTFNIEAEKTDASEPPPKTDYARVFQRTAAANH